MQNFKIFRPLPNTMHKKQIKNTQRQNIIPEFIEYFEENRSKLLQDIENKVSPMI